MASKLSQDDRNLKIIREIMARPENKKCFDCTERGPVNICMDFGTFVCTTCGGIHREFSHRVKSISMASFKPEEMQRIQKGGNAVAREQWLARWEPREWPEPEAGDIGRIRDFIRMKYIEKRWVNRGAAPSQAQPVGNTSYAARPQEPPPTEPLTKILGNNIPPIRVGSTASSPAAVTRASEPASWRAGPAPAPTPAPAPAKSLLDFDFSAPAPAPTPAPAAPAFQAFQTNFPPANPQPQAQIFAQQPQAQPQPQLIPAQQSAQPVTQSNSSGKKPLTDDILSLFSEAIPSQPAQTTQTASNDWGSSFVSAKPATTATPAAQSWGAPQQPPQQPQQNTQQFSNFFQAPATQQAYQQPAQPQLQQYQQPQLQQPYQQPQSYQQSQQPQQPQQPYQQSYQQPQQQMWQQPQPQLQQQQAQQQQQFLMQQQQQAQQQQAQQAQQQQFLMQQQQQMYLQQQRPAQPGQPGIPAQQAYAQYPQQPVPQQQLYGMQPGAPAQQYGYPGAPSPAGMMQPGVPPQRPQGPELFSELNILGGGAKKPANSPYGGGGSLF